TPFAFLGLYPTCSLVLIEESVSSKIDLPEDDPYSIKLMIEFLYKGNYTPMKDQKVFESFDFCDPKNILKTHISLYALGDKYGIPTLSHRAAWRLFADLDRDFNGANPEIVLYCVPRIYSSTPENDRTLRDCVVERVMNHSHIIDLHENSKRQLMEHINNVKDFREDLFGAFLKAKRIVNEI
ncbi:MAG: hypothetical protein Q9181_002664, partial [Wetmoreana brouardii]